MRWILLLAFTINLHLALSKIRHARGRAKRQDEEARNWVWGDDGGGAGGGDWGPWSGPSPCSRPCGGGVQNQTRTCRSSGCWGSSVRYMTCNPEECLDGADFRAIQCAQYNDIPYEGIHYDWIPYTKAPNKCALNCMPRGERFYYRHSDKVVDGTLCSDESLDVCVNGECRHVGCDKMLGSELEEDRCRVCGGDGSSCETKKDTLYSNDYKVGYNDLFMVPAGATNIRVKEVRPSNNYLAIRNASNHYYLNGNWRIDYPRILKFAGTVFHYGRKPHGFFAPESIVALGPTTEILFVVLLYQEMNPGIEYEYSVPEGSVIQTDPEGYTWFTSSFSDCSVSCGGGFQSRQVWCAKVKDSTEAPAELCDAAHEPASTQGCSTEPCPPEWHIPSWSSCSVSCGNGTQSRMVYCEQVVSGAGAILLNDSICINSVGEKPEMTQPCGDPRPCPIWHVGPWKPCDKLCGDGIQRRMVQCYWKVDGKIELLLDSHCSEADRPDSEKPCTLRPCEGVDWVTGEWSGCSEKCGLAFETREAVCSNAEGKIFNDSLCHDYRKPELKRMCKQPESCPVQWYASQWSPCSAKCGAGVQSRHVFCGSFVEAEGTVKKVQDSECIASEKFEEERPCTGEGQCKGEWFFGAFGQCSKACGGGLRSRKVLCFMDNELVKDVECDQNALETLIEPCNVHPCGLDEILPVDADSAIMEESSEECEEGEEGQASGEEEEDDQPMLTTQPGMMTSKKQADAESFENLIDVIDVRFGDTKPEKIEEDEGSGDMSTVFTESSSVTLSSDSTGDSTQSRMSSEPSPSGSSTDTISSETVSTDSITDTTSQRASGSTDMDMTTIVVSDATQTTIEDSASTKLDVTSSAISSDETTLLFSASTLSSDDSSTSSSDLSSTVSSDSSSTLSSDQSSTVSSDLSSTLSQTDTTTGISQSDMTTTEGTSDGTSSDLTTKLEETSPTVSSDSTTPLLDATTGASSSSDGTASSSSEATTEADVSSASTGSESDGSTMSSDTSTLEPSTEQTSELGETSVSPLTESSSESSWASSVISTIVSIMTESSSERTDSLTSELSTDTTSDSFTESATHPSDMESSDVQTDSDATTPAISQTVFRVTSPVESVVTQEQTVKKCKKRPKIKKCVSSEFGCCPDGRTPAKGPFGKECPKIETCKDTKYDCCEDGVSPAKGLDFAGCPPSMCNETLFGCCPNGVNEALGNEFEGCPLATTLAMDCSSSEFGCCPDGILSATGPNFGGCYECEGVTGACDSCLDTKYGCCPDNMTQATGPDYEGCDLPLSTTEFTMITMGASEECDNSTYGCCPDGMTLATGPDDEGCQTTVPCQDTQFGCCPDGKTTASGDKMEGCEVSCATETHGCCDDNITPAHGPNKEGCCLLSPYGCCHDNIEPAQGPNYEGCSCEKSPYGCCPDGQAAAEGPDKEGCGCQYSEHGCCPDRISPASGPEYEGCSCHTYQFGCCPDGINHAVGPRLLGCGCENSIHGCCPDGKTPKPEEGNCTCDASLYGCCLDGVTPADGEKFDGCKTKPKRPGDICGLPKDRGPCREFTVKWHYDTEYGGCSRFWFGSCEGNGNKFNSQDECKQTCVEPEGRDACYLPKIAGPCQGYYPRWHYDPARKDCSQFVYGGCLGNNNKFATVEECRQLCVIPQHLDACDQEVDAGPCEGNYERWYFDKEANTCFSFRYGGCEGNKNNFMSETACSSKCLSSLRQKSDCSLPKAEGDCSSKLARWYFDSSENRCMPFYYSGCGGNNNNYAYFHHCQEDCPAKIEKSVCGEAPAEGECHNFTIRYYFDTLESRCKQFYYGGCRGNANNFQSEFDCYKQCEPSKLPAEPQEPPFTRDMCLLPYKIGSCSNSIPSWFFDSRDGLCKEFEYSGCDGNGNRFESMEECQASCDGVVDICRLGTVQVRCDASTSQVWYYYDPAYESCIQYADALCPGNANRFESREACQKRCRGEVLWPPVTQAPYLPDICWAKLDPGPCLQQETAWWYDQTTGRCQPFVYGGCEGNANRFSSEEQCERQCGQFRRHDTCWENKDVGSCDQVQTKFYFDTVTKRCEEFEYSGCGGNTNRYSTEEECRSVCIAKQEPPITPGENTQLAHQEICRLAVEPGSCSGYIERYHFDEATKVCSPFVFTGCSANLNNFNTYDECMAFCAPQQPPEVDGGEDDCYEEQSECNALVDCPYGIERKASGRGCIVCSCHAPCDGFDCGSDSVCSVRAQTNPITLNLEYIPVCHPVSKGGRCPEVSLEATCDELCSKDSQCPGLEKCCYNGCGTQCLSPVFDHDITTSRPQPPQGVEAPQILTDEADTNVVSEEGNYASLKCVVSGSPIPQITWKKDSQLINSTGTSKYRLLSDGTLQVIGLIKDDSGLYICIAENGIGRPVTREFHLKVNDGVPLRPSVLGEDNADIVVELGAPAMLTCRAIGWPRPDVMWFRGNHLLGFSTQEFEQARDFTLLIKSVKLPHLGFYTCQAYNGFDRPASYKIALKAFGPAQPADPNDVTYDQFLVPPPRGPKPPPYLPRPRPRPTTQPPPPPPPPPTKRYTVPVKVRIDLDRNEYAPGQDISLPCDVEGFPSPQVFWYKNGEQLYPSNRITITDSHRLIIADSEVTDSGRYRCHADNTYTSNEASVQIQVKGLFVPPDCTDNPFFANCKLIVKAKYCSHEYYAKFCCKSCTEAGQIEHTRFKRSLPSASLDPEKINILPASKEKSYWSTLFKRDIKSLPKLHTNAVNDVKVISNLKKSPALHN